jgi:hypothetical protein
MVAVDEKAEWNNALFYDDKAEVRDLLGQE